MLQVYRNLLIVGDAACGKTALLNRITSGQWKNSEYTPTVFDNYMADPVETEYTRVELALWDVSGSEVYDELR